MKPKYILLIMLVFSSSVFAQQRSLVAFTYDVSLPLSATKEFVNEVSWLGFNVDFRKPISRNAWVGLGFGWNVFAEEVNEVVHIENEQVGGDLSGNQGRYINSFPILVNLSYAFKSGGRSNFVPFIGVNTGIYIINQRFNIGIYQFDNNHTHFGVAPEIGFLMKTGSVNIFFNTRYNYAFDAGERMNGDENNYHSYLSFNIGFAYDRVSF